MHARALRRRQRGLELPDRLPARRRLPERVVRARRERSNGQDLVLVRRGRDALRARRRQRRRGLALHRGHRLRRRRRPSAGPLRLRAASATRSSRRRSSPTARSSSAWTSTTCALGKGGFYAVDVETGRSPGSSTSRRGSDLHAAAGRRDHALRRLPQRGRARAAGRLPLARRAATSRPRATAAATSGRRPRSTSARGALFTASSNCDTDERSRHRRAGAADAALRRGDLLARPRRQRALALAPARGRQRRPRLRRGAEPVQHRRRRRPDRRGRHRQQGRHLLRARPRRRQRARAAWPGTTPIRRSCRTGRRNVVPGGAFGGVVATASVDETSPPRLLHAPRRATPRSRC